MTDLTAPTAPLRCPLDLEALIPAQDFPQWWQRASDLVGLPVGTGLATISVSGAGLPQLLKQLHSLEGPRRALLLAMACLAQPGIADWLQREQGLNFGQLTAADLGPEVFQVLVGLLATFHTHPKNHEESCHAPPATEAE